VGDHRSRPRTPRQAGRGLSWTPTDVLAAERPNVAAIPAHRSAQLVPQAPGPLAGAAPSPSGDDADASPALRRRRRALRRGATRDAPGLAARLRADALGDGGGESLRPGGPGRRADPAGGVVRVPFWRASAIPRTTPIQRLLACPLPGLSLNGPLGDISGASDRAVRGALITDDDLARPLPRQPSRVRPRPHESEPLGSLGIAVATRASRNHQLRDCSLSRSRRRAGVWTNPVRAVLR
jgi:hypothetical protein